VVGGDDAGRVIALGATPCRGGRPRGPNAHGREHVMIDAVVEQWHRFMRGELPEALDDLLADEVVFYSPIVYTPQEGKDVTKLYLRAAAATLPGDGGAPASGEPSPGGAFRYTKQVTSGDTAVLEFETTVDGKYVNGVDIIRCDDDGRIVEFRVMIRPLQAVNIVHEKMRAMFESMGPPA
jgi:hypothetical protein